MSLASSKRQRVWQQMREYTAKRRVKGAAKKCALQHFRWVRAPCRGLPAAVSCLHVPLWNKQLPWEMGVSGLAMQ